MAQPELTVASSNSHRDSGGGPRLPSHGSLRYQSSGSHQLSESSLIGVLPAGFWPSYNGLKAKPYQFPFAKLAAFLHFVDVEQTTYSATGDAFTE